MTKRWLVAPLVLGFVVLACGDDAAQPTDEPTAEATMEATTEPTPEATVEATAEPTVEATAEPTAEATAEATVEATAETAAASSGATAMLGENEIVVEQVLCYFEEQPRAGLGGVWTHTLQARGTNVAGEPVVISLDRARGEDGEVEDSIIVDIGEPGAEEAVSLSATGAEGLIEFGDTSAAALDVAVSEFGSDPVTLSIEVACS